MAKRTNKKSLRKQINPEKSNKMIYAVAAGLGVIFVAFLIFMLSGDSKPESKEDFMKNTLAYLEKTEGVLDVAFDVPSNQVTIVYEEKEKMDFTRVAQYAGLKLSNRMTEETFKIVLAKDERDNIQFTFLIKDGNVDQVLKGNTVNK
jgi:hypothetical protein